MVHVIDLKFSGVSDAIAAFLIETSEGPILLETGPYSTFPTLSKGIEKIGYKVSDIKHVFLTHIHLDHAGAAWAFAETGATIYMHPFGERHMIDPSKLYNSAKRIYQDQMDILWGILKPIPKEQIKIVTDRETFQIGDTAITGFFTPGHAVHHIAYQVGDSLIAGDVAGVCINNGAVVAPCPPPDINIEDWRNSINIVRSLDLKEIYLTHFGLVTAIPEHLTALEKVLLDWKAWIKPYFDAQTPIPEIIPKFEAHVAKSLIEFGSDEATIVRYGAANPAWMSVAGLLRYWKKHTSAS